MENVFKVGDIIKGKKNRYGITNEKMTKAIVLEAFGDEMLIKILEHETDKGEVGEEFHVDNSDEYFTLIGKQSTEKYKEDEDDDDIILD